MERILRSARLLVALFAVACAGSAWPCVNSFDGAILQYQAMRDAEGITKILGKLEKAHAETPTLENSNDLGVALMLTGKLAESIKLLEETDRKFPGSAKVASNLGTALELQGKDEDALKWIREGVNRDANEHQGSEWLHARILTAKIALKQDPNWLLKNHVLDLDFGTGDVPVAPEILPIENGKLKGVQQLLDQINDQLLERMKFVTPPDAIMSDIFSSAGDLALAGGVSVLDGGEQRPDKYYEASLTYGALRAKLVQSRRDRYKAHLAPNPPPAKAAGSSSIEVVDAPVINKRFAPKQERSYTLLIWLVAGTVVTLLLVFVGWLVDRHRKKQAALNPPPPLPDVD